MKAKSSCRDDSPNEVEKTPARSPDLEQQKTYGYSGRQKRIGAGLVGDRSIK